MDIEWPAVAGKLAVLLRPLYQPRANYTIAAALGLVEDKPFNDSISGVIQVMNRFVLERMSSDYKQVLPQSTAFEQVSLLVDRPAGSSALISSDDRHHCSYQHSVRELPV